MMNRSIFIRLYFSFWLIYIGFFQNLYSQNCPGGQIITYSISNYDFSEQVPGYEDNNGVYCKNPDTYFSDVFAIDLVSGDTVRGTFSREFSTTQKNTIKNISFTSNEYEMTETRSFRLVFNFTVSCSTCGTGNCDDVYPGTTIDVQGESQFQRTISEDGVFTFTGFESPRIYKEENGGAYCIPYFQEGILSQTTSVYQYVPNGADINIVSSGLNFCIAFKAPDYQPNEAYYLKLNGTGNCIGNFEKHYPFTIGSTSNWDSMTVATTMEVKKDTVDCYVKSFEVVNDLPLEDQPYLEYVWSGMYTSTIRGVGKKYIPQKNENVTLKLRSKVTGKVLFYPFNNLGFHYKYEHTPSLNIDYPNSGIVLYKEEAWFENEKFAPSIKGKYSLNYFDYANTILWVNSDGIVASVGTDLAYTTLTTGDYIFVIGAENKDCQTQHYDSANVKVESFLNIPAELRSNLDSIVIEGVNCDTIILKAAIPFQSQHLERVWLKNGDIEGVGDQIIITASNQGQYSLRLRSKYTHRFISTVGGNFYKSIYFNSNNNYYDMSGEFFVIHQKPESLLYPLPKPQEYDTTSSIYYKWESSGSGFTILNDSILSLEGQTPSDSIPFFLSYYESSNGYCWTDPKEITFLFRGSYEKAFIKSLVAGNDDRNEYLVKNISMGNCKDVKQFDWYINQSIVKEESVDSTFFGNTKIFPISLQNRDSLFLVTTYLDSTAIRYGEQQNTKVYKVNEHYKTKNLIYVNDDTNH